MKDRALVLLSGGADSTAALHWALHNYRQVSAVTYDYGQAARDHERGLPSLSWRSATKRRSAGEVADEARYPDHA